MVLNAGDCVLQPPMIRHRVLESSAGAEVIEIGTPAEHITIAEHTLTLPSADLPADHDFGGQRFVRHVAQDAPWNPWRVAGFEYRDTGIGGATDGLAGARVVRRTLEPVGAAQQHETEFCFYFVLQGELNFRHGNGDESIRLKRDDSITVPAGLRYRLDDSSADLELLEVTLPDTVTMTE
jgi:mannose-6-phosphate isomerase-like protein (cupin superfamily)